MSIATALSTLESRRSDIVNSINLKGGTLEDNATLAECKTAIDNLDTGGGGTTWTGHVDEVGLKAIGWTDDDIDYFKEDINWNEEDDEKYEVSQDLIDYYGTLTKITIEGKTMVDGDAEISNIQKAYKIFNTMSSQSGYDLYKNFIYLPKLYFSKFNLSNYFSGFYSVIAFPSLEIGSSTSYPTCTSLYRNCRSAISINVSNFSSILSSGITVYPSFYQLFGSCSNIKRIDFGGNVKTNGLEGAFSGCSKLEKSNFFKQLKSVSGITCYQCFSGCSSLDVDFNNIDGDNVGLIVNRASTMFYGCSKIRNIKLNLTVESSSITDYTNGDSFSGLYNLESFYITGTNTQRSNYNSYIKDYTITSESSFAGYNHITKLKKYILDDSIDLSGTLRQDRFLTYQNNPLPYTICQDFDSMKSILEAMNRATFTFSPSLYCWPNSVLKDDEEGTIDDLIMEATEKGYSIINLTVE